MIDLKIKREEDMKMSRENIVKLKKNIEIKEVRVL